NEGFELLVTLFEGDDRPPIFAVPPGGDAVSFVEIAKRFSGRTMVGVQAQGLDGRKPPLTTIEEMGARYVDEIVRFQSDGPYHFVTICGGGTVLLDVVARLQRMGKTVESFIVIDPTWIFPENSYPDFKPGRTMVQTVRKLTGVVLSGEIFSKVADRVKLLVDRRRGHRRHMEEIDALDDARRRVVDTYHDAAIEYGPKKVSGVLTAVVSRQWQEKVDFEARIRRWEFLVEGGVDCQFIEASHYSMSLGEHAGALAGLIEELVDRNEARARENLGQDA
ncbi:MAG: thioesterase domain-containing protein, partial [Rhodothermales bacterium]|nr:thioesterase domain-containing protein [Rhodothermales bacterium]